MANTSGGRAANSPSSRGDINSLRQTVAALERTVLLIAEANAVPNILFNSFEEISAKLEPLRNLDPQFKPLGEEAAAILIALLQDLERPHWGSLGGVPAAARPR